MASWAAHMHSGSGNALFNADGAALNGILSASCANGEPPSQTHSRHSSTASSLRRSMGLPPSFTVPPPPPCAPPPRPLLASSTFLSDFSPAGAHASCTPQPADSSPVATPWWLSFDRRILTRSSASRMGESEVDMGDDDDAANFDPDVANLDIGEQDELLSKLAADSEGGDSLISQGTNGGMRWIALALCCLLLFGNFYAYDNPSAISVQMHEHLGVPYAQFAVYLNLFYSVYSLPNVFLTLISGWLMDRFGISRVLLILGTLVCTGQFLFALGLSHKSLNLMLLGRVLFGLGGESVGVAQASITTSWFRNKELAFALGINLCIARLGSVVNAMISPRIAMQWGVVWAAWAGVVACCASFVAGCMLAGVVGVPPGAIVAVAAPVVEPMGVDGLEGDLPRAVRRYFEEQQQQQQQNLAQEDDTECEVLNRHPARKEIAEDCQPLLLAPSANGALDGSQTPLEGTTAGASSASASSGQSIVLGYGTLSAPRRHPTSTIQRQLTSPGPHDALLAVSHHSPADLLLPIAPPPPPPARRPTAATSLFDNDRRSTLTQTTSTADPTSLFGTMRHLPLSFYLVCLICILLYPTVISFTAIASEFLQSKWYPGDPASAGIVMSTPDSLSAILVPILGLLIDKYGRRCTSMALCALLMAGSHCILALADAAHVSPMVGMVPLGVAYSLYGTAMWPGIACVVRDARWVATAYGAATAALNASLAITPVAVAWAVVRASKDKLNEQDGWARFVPVEFMFMGMAVAGFLVSCVLYVVDRSEGGYLEVPEVGQVQMVAVSAGNATSRGEGDQFAIVLPAPDAASRTSSARGNLRRRLTGLGIIHRSRTSSADGGNNDSTASTPHAATTRPPAIVASPLVTPMFFHPMIRSASVNSLIAASTHTPASPASTSLHPLSRSASISVVSPSTIASSVQASPVVRNPPARATTETVPGNGSRLSSAVYRRIRGPPSSSSSLAGNVTMVPAVPVLSAIMEQHANGHANASPRRVQSYVHVRDVFSQPDAKDKHQEGEART